MRPQSRGLPLKPPPVPHGFQSRSTPNLPTLRSIEASSSNDSSATASINGPVRQQQQARSSPDATTNPSEPGSIDDFSLGAINDPPSLSPASSDDEDASEDEHDVQIPANASRRPVHLLQSRSYTHLAPSAFAPPFYNRPPTPLPPSPSLSSLLKPSFTSQNSRPTTPDPSSDEASGTPQTRTGTQTPNSAAASTLTSSYRTAKPIPRASPRVPTYEYYGFTLYLTSTLVFLVYLLWSFLPSPFLKQLGIYYYPDRWWALAIPAWTVMGVIYIYVALAAYNTGYLTLPMNSVECLVDEAASIAVVDSQGRLIYHDQPSWSSGHAKKERKKGGRRRQGSVAKPEMNGELEWRTLWMEGTDAVMDIPVGGVCEILYGLDEEKGEDDVRGNAHDR